MTKLKTILGAGVLAAAGGAFVLTRRPALAS